MSSRVDDFLSWAEVTLGCDPEIIEAYLFGSALLDWQCARDIDLLILTGLTGCGNLGWRPLGGLQSWQGRAIHFTICNQRESEELRQFLGKCGTTHRIK